MPQQVPPPWKSLQCHSTIDQNTMTTKLIVVNQARAWLIDHLATGHFFTIWKPANWHNLVFLCSGPISGFQNRIQKLSFKLHDLSIWVQYAKKFGVRLRVSSNIPIPFVFKFLHCYPFIVFRWMNLPTLDAHHQQINRYIHKIYLSKLVQFVTALKISSSSKYSNLTANFWQSAPWKYTSYNLGQIKNSP